MAPIDPTASPAPAAPTARAAPAAGGAVQPPAAETPRPAAPPIKAPAPPSASPCPEALPAPSPAKATPAKATSTAATPNDAGPTTFVLTATNRSLLPGNQYFNVFPPPLLTVTPNQPQTPLALVSPPTNAQGPTSPDRKNPLSPNTVPITWEGGADALALYVLNKGQTVEGLQPTPVTLGCTVKISWEEGVFSSVVTRGQGMTISLEFDPSVPPNVRVGLKVGPAPVLVPVPADGAGLSLMPDLSPVVKVRFGTACPPEPSAVSDLSNPATVTLSGSTTKSAALLVEADNVIQVL
ncbi:hypothetical protein [Pararhodospirillum oryzae]|uniref:Uncharacterized protein n=1 Tax=Pararhodospirillum oryzae TaxID=478448 RepID=A0A512HAD7_9PROT|nr:hypothetical protein [Pararhodospirillum oryzae]GEO82360.1 hypothetical protein ROR02_24910 [Pararhodospirillum oryzae]